MSPVVGLHTLTVEEYQVARDAAARVVRFVRVAKRRGRKQGHSEVWPGPTADDVVGDYLGMTEDGPVSRETFKRWHRILDAACTIANRVLDRTTKRTRPPEAA
ncbi:MAG: hypothetical protein ACLFWG_10175 [Longimicrobiales bacterium]